LIKSYPPNSPPSQEARSQDFEKWKKLHGGPCGIYRFTIHKQCGHPNTEPSYAAQFFGGSSQHTAAAWKFRTAGVIHCLSELISVAFAGIDPDMWGKYQETYIKAQNNYPILKKIDPPLQCFVGYCLLVNM
jgi:hypothetical protein